MNIKRYYIVPITARTISMNGVSLLDVLKEVDLDLYIREEMRIRLSYERMDVSDEYLKSYNRETDKLYRMKQIPTKMIIASTGDGLVELTTQEEIGCSNRSYLETFAVSPKKVNEHLTNDYDYLSNIDSFVQKYKEKKQKNQKNKCKTMNA